MRIFKKQTEQLSARLANRVIYSYLNDERIIADDLKLRFIPGPSENEDENFIPNTLFAIREIPGNSFWEFKPVYISIKSNILRYRKSIFAVKQSNILR